MSIAAQSAIATALKALQTLRRDIRLSGLKNRQRSMTQRVRRSIESIEWLLDYETARCDHDA